MNRKLFFWLEKLKITPYERITVVSLLVLLLVLTSLNLVIDPKPSTDTEDYQAILQKFKRRTALNAKKEEQLMQRYHPNPAALVTGTRDTLTKVQADTSEQTTAQTEKARQVESKLININTASLDQLETLPGVGPVYAKRIITYRKENERFSAANELINIKGIGPKRLEAIKPLITTE